MLKAESINTFYEDVQALHDVSFRIDEGRIVSIIGSNGAGKSTTLNTLSGVIPVKSGSIEFLGKRIDRLKPHQIVNLRLIQIPEARLLFPMMTVKENLLLGAYSRDARAQKQGNLEFVYELFPILQDRAKAIGGDLERRPAADARHRERSYGHAEAPHAGRTLARSGAADRNPGFRYDQTRERAGHHDPPRRTKMRSRP